MDFNCWWKWRLLRILVPLFPVLPFPDLPIWQGAQATKTILDDNKNGKKALRLDRQNKNFFVNFFAVVARLRRETGSMDTYKKNVIVFGISWGV